MATKSRQKNRALEAMKRVDKYYAERGIVARDPVEILLLLANDVDLKIGDRIDAAKAAAPYIHARLVTMQHTGEDGGPITHAHLLLDLMKNPKIASAMEELTFEVEGARAVQALPPAYSPRQLTSGEPAGANEQKLPILDAEPLE